MVGKVGSDLQRWSCPTSLLKQGHLEPVGQDQVQMAFEYLQRGKLCSLPGQPVPVFGHPCGKEVFPDVPREPPVFPFVPITSDPVTGNSWKEPGSILFAPSFRWYLYKIAKIPPEPSLLQAEQSQLSAFLTGEMLWSCNSLSGPLLDSPVCPSLFYWRVELESVL